MRLFRFALLLFFGVRPLMRSFAASTEAAADGDATADAVAIETPDAETPAAAGTPGAPGEQPRPKPMAEPVIVEEEEEFVSLASVSGNVMRRHIDELTKLIEVEPEGSLRIIRSWINQKS